MNWTNITDLITQSKTITPIITAAILILLILLLHIFKKNLIYIARKKTQINSKNIAKLELPIILIGATLTIQILANQIINTYTNISTEISIISKTLLLILITYTATILSNMILEKWNKNIINDKKTKAHEEILPLTKSITHILIIVTAILMILQIWGVQIGGLIASLGIAGIILSFAFKDTLANIFGGITLTLDNTFKKGDLIELEDGELGYIEEVNLRSTKIKNFDEQEVLIPNGKIANMKIKNYAQPTKSMRIKIPVSIAYGSNKNKFYKIIYELLEKDKKVSTYPEPKIFFEKMGEYALEFKVTFHIQDYHKFYKIQSEYTDKIYDELNNNNIKIPFPTQTIQLK